MGKMPVAEEAKVLTWRSGSPWALACAAVNVAGIRSITSP